MKPRSKPALWAISGASPTNSRKASTTSGARTGLAAQEGARQAVHPLGLGGMSRQGSM
jgi:hypothetical protein